MFKVEIYSFNNYGLRIYTCMLYNLLLIFVVAKVEQPKPVEPPQPSVYIPPSKRNQVFNQKAKWTASEFFVIPYNYHDVSQIYTCKYTILLFQKNLI